MTVANWEQRTLHSFGDNVRLDINNPQTTTGGNAIYQWYSVTNEEQDVCIVGHNENGLYHIYNDGTIEIVGGMKGGSNGVNVLIEGKNGDVAINADRNGYVRIRGKGIVIQADEDIDLNAGRNVNIKSGSGRILLKGNTLEEDGLLGNLLPDQLQWAWRVFEGTGLPGEQFLDLVPGFSGISDLAGTLLDAPSQFGDFVQGSIDNAISSAISQAG